MLNQYKIEMKNLGREFRNYYRGNNRFGMTAFDAYQKHNSNQILSKVGPQGVTSYKDNLVGNPSSYLNPYVIEERPMNITQLDVCSRLMMDRLIFFATEVNADTANIIKAQLLFLENTDPTSEITINIDSPGGGVYSGNGILDTMDLIKCDVRTINTGMAASFGAMILLNGTAGKRGGTKRSTVMIHQPLGGAQGQASDIEITANEILRLKKDLCMTIAERTGQSYEQVVKDTDRDNYLGVDDAMGYGTLGLIDYVVGRE